MSNKKIPIKSLRSGPVPADTQTMNTDYTPSPKVAAGGIAGAASVVLIFAAGQLGLEIPAEVASALTTILAFAAAYLKSN